MPLFGAFLGTSKSGTRPMPMMPPVMNCFPSVRFRSSNCKGAVPQGQRSPEGRYQAGLLEVMGRSVDCSRWESSLVPRVESYPGVHQPSCPLGCVTAFSGWDPEAIGAPFVCLF